MYATEKQNHGSDCSLIVVSLTTENNRIIHIRKAVAFSDFTFLLQTFCNLLYQQTTELMPHHVLLWLGLASGNRPVGDSPMEMLTMLDLR